MLKILFTFITKQATLKRSSTVLSLPLQLVFPGRGIIFHEAKKFLSDLLKI